MTTYTLTGRMDDGWTLTESGLTKEQALQIVANCIDMCSSMEITREP